MIKAKIAECFDVIKWDARDKVMSDKNFDGKAYWKKLKEQLSDIRCSFKWNKVVIQSAFEDIAGVRSTDEKKMDEELLMPEYVDYPSIKNIPNHLFIEHLRIPLYEEPTMIKLMQIAYNAGQLIPLRDQIVEEKMQSYLANRLDHIQTYTYVNDIEITEGDLQKLINLMDSLENQKGGFYYKKYMKYKYKYIRNKKN